MMSIIGCGIYYAYRNLQAEFMEDQRQKAGDRFVVAIFPVAVKGARQPEFFKI